MSTDFWSLFPSTNDENLSDLLRQAEIQREKFNSTDGVGSTENRSIVSQLKNGISAAKKLLEQHEQIRNQQRKLAIETKTHLNKSEDFAKDFRTTGKRLTNITKIIDYLRCLEILFDLSRNLEKTLANRSFDEALIFYQKLAQLTESIHDTSVEHLRNYSAELTIFWYENLKNVFATRIEHLLHEIKFPYVQKLPTDDLVEAFENHRSELKIEINLIEKLRLPQRLSHVDNQSRLKLIGWKPIPLLIQFLLKSLVVRFHFHFNGNQKTNDRSKPEWFLNQIISWILDHDYFLVKQLQPLLDDESKKSENFLKVEFIRGLIELVIGKLNNNITSILVDTPLFTHYVEEILSFSQRLFEIDIDYPKTLPNCMNFLCDEIVFEKWFQVEEDVARMKLNRIFQSKSAHETVYERLLERNPDDIKISECAETFLTLIHAMEDRYRLVPYPSCSLRLFSLQLNLFDEFLEDLKFSTINEQNEFDPLSKRFCSVLNSIVFIADVIQQWKSRSFYRRLQHFYDEYKIFEKNFVEFSPIDQTTDDRRIHIDSTLAQQFDSTQMKKEQILVTAILFDPVLEKYRDEEEKHSNNIVNFVVKLLKSRSQIYINEKWSSMTNSKDFLLMNITPSAADILLKLQTTFSTLLMNLVKSVYDEIRARIIIEYDKFLFNCIVTDQWFNEGGAAQFSFDVNRGWSRIGTDHISQLFNKCRESAMLLTMPLERARRLANALEQETSLLSLTTLTFQDNSDSFSSLPSPLIEYGIHHLGEFEANQVLQHRLDLIQH